MTSSSTPPLPSVRALLDRLAGPFEAATGFPLAPHLVALVRAGSATYNLQLDAAQAGYVSDTDLFAVVLPPPHIALGLDRFDTWVQNDGELDITIHSLEKYLQLLVKLNPSMLQPLWVRDQDVLLETPLWAQLRAARDLFASRDLSKTFGQYARSQLALMNVFDDATAAEWTAAQDLILRAGWTVEAVVLQKGRPMPKDKTLSADVLEAACVTLRRIHARHFQGYMGSKRKGIVVTHGFDVRQASHVLRLARQGREFLETGRLDVWREHDAEQLRAVKAGQVPLETVKAWAEAELAALEQVVAHSPLPDTVDRAACSRLMAQLQLDGLHQLQTLGHLPTVSPQPVGGRSPRPPAARAGRR